MRGFGEKNARRNIGFSAAVSTLALICGFQPFVTLVAQGANEFIFHEPGNPPVIENARHFPWVIPTPIDYFIGFSGMRGAATSGRASRR